MGRLVVAALVALSLACCASVKLPPEPQGCIIKITYNPAWQLTVYKEARIPQGTWEIINGMPSPKFPCAWVVTINPADMYASEINSAFGGGQCIEPLVQCMSGNCP